MDPLGESDLFDVVELWRRRGRLVDGEFVSDRGESMRGELLVLCRSADWGELGGRLVNELRRGVTLFHLRSLWRKMSSSKSLILSCSDVGCVRGRPLFIQM